MDFLSDLARIILINILLSADNAIIIALCCRGLPESRRIKAILWGCIGEISVRFVLTLMVVSLLNIPYLQTIGGILLASIAVKLLGEETPQEQVQASASFWSTVKTIIIADLVMSFDNTLAIAAASEGKVAALAAGLALSIPLIIIGSRMIVRIMNEYPVVVYLGAAGIAWLAGDMILHDPKIGGVLLEYTPAWLLPALISIGVIVLGWWRQSARQVSGDEP